MPDRVWGKETPYTAGGIQNGGSTVENSKVAPHKTKQNYHMTLQSCSRAHIHTKL